MRQPPFLISWNAYQRRVQNSNFRRDSQLIADPDSVSRELGFNHADPTGALLAPIDIASSKPWPKRLHLRELLVDRQGRTVGQIFLP